MTRLRCARNVAAGTVVSLVVFAALSSSAFAQVPETPELPEVPEPVADALGEAQGMLVPVLVDAATTASPVANALGFGLRPACAGAGSVIVLGALLGATLPLPVNPGLGLVPAFILCGAAFEPGPADPAFEQVDAVAGPQVESASETVLEPTATTIAPLRPTLSEACTVVSLVSGAGKYAPPPLHRVDLLGALC